MADEAKQKKVKATKEILQFAGKNISAEDQEILNRPLVSPQEINEADEKFLAEVLQKIESKEIDLYRPSSLINQMVYEKATPEAQAQTEIDALNLLTTLRQLRSLYLQKAADTYQFQNMLHQFRLTKERIEEQAGDVFII